MIGLIGLIAINPLVFKTLSSSHTKIQVLEDTTIALKDGEECVRTVREIQGYSRLVCHNSKSNFQPLAIYRRREDESLLAIVYHDQRLLVSILSCQLSQIYMFLCFIRFTFFFSCLRILYE